MPQTEIITFAAAQRVRVGVIRRAAATAGLTEAVSVGLRSSGPVSTPRSGTAGSRRPSADAGWQSQST